MASSSNKRIMSSGHSTQSRIILDFSSEGGRAAIHQWYKRQGSNTRFTSLEYRKDRKGWSRHEFIVVRLDPTTLCRFDRRAQDNIRGRALKDKGTATEDSAHILRIFETGYQELVEKSKVLVSISFPDGEDLRLLLAICFGIQAQSRATSFSPLHYNCCFFSWTIVTAVARHTVIWEDVLTPEIVQEAILQATNNDTCGYLYTHLHMHARTVPSQDLCDRIRTRFVNPAIATRPASTVSDGQGIMDLWGIYGFHSAHQEEVWSFDHLLRKQLLRSHLAPALTKEIKRFAQTTLLRAMCSVAECDIQELVFSQLELKHQTSNSHSHLFPGVAALAENICRTVAGRMVAINDENSSKNERRGANVLVMDDVWDHAGRNHHSELLDLDSGYLGGRGVASADEFGKAVKEIGKKTMQGARGKYAKLAFKHSSVLANKVAAELLEMLDDLDPERLTFGGSAKRTLLARSKRHLEQLEVPPLQAYIRYCMQDHFGMVDRFGFRSFERLLTTAEESMCKIWLTTVDVLDRDISSWAMNPLEKQASGWDSDSDWEYIDSDSDQNSKYHR